MTAQNLLRVFGLDARLLIDCSHANSNKDHRLQGGVFKNVVGQRLGGNRGIVGVMLESHLNEGNQSLGDDLSELKYGVSITDACIGWEETEKLLTETHEALSGSKAGALA